ncbi:MAG: hypothetical protein MUF49_27230 [Oculatellaceae cyanobacterium Prado106]|jgi:Uma2 family endonuclease|nr:hypothetical protein [Oculatellaceae cyanobacterium Prado106]
MVNILPTSQNLVTDAWVSATWEEFLAIVNRPELEKAQCYYDQGWMRIETMPIGFAHARDNALLASVVSLYGTLKNLPFLSITNGSFRKTGISLVEAALQRSQTEEDGAINRWLIEQFS